MIEWVLIFVISTKYVVTIEEVYFDRQDDCERAALVWRTEPLNKFSHLTVNCHERWDNEEKDR